MFDSILSQLFTKIDPNSLSLTALIYVLVIFGLVFLWKRVWPHYTTVVVPMQQKIREMERTAKIDNEKRRLDADIEKDKHQTAVMESVRDALLELKIVSAGISQMLNKQQDSLTANFNEMLTRLEKVDLVVKEK